MIARDERGVTLGPVAQLYLVGGGRLLLRFAEWACASGFTVSIVTSPRHAAEQPDGATSFHELAERLCRVQVVEDINAPMAASALAGFDDSSIALSLGAAWIFKRATIETLFRNRLLNLHGARLPQNRGGGGFSWQILQGSRLGFCLLHQVDGGVDTGAILAVEEFLYPAGCRTPVDYQATYEHENLAFLQRIFSAMRQEPVPFRVMEQPEYLSTYWPRLHTPTHAWIDWNLPADALDRLIRAFDDPYPGAQTFWNGQPVSLKKTLTDASDGLFHAFQWGIVYRNNGRWLSVAVNGGTLIVQSVVDASGASVLAAIRAGDRFFTPQDKLENRSQRVVYDPRGLKQR